MIFEYGKAKEGYWNNVLFMEQMDTAAKTAEAKYPPRVYKHVWILDHSCRHTAYAPDALVVPRLNKKPGGKQPAMRDTTWAGKPQKLVMEDGTPKGAGMILEERGINTGTLKLEDMRVILSCHDDFKNEKSALHRKLEAKGTLFCSCPSFIVNSMESSEYGGMRRDTQELTAITSSIHFGLQCQQLYSKRNYKKRYSKISQLHVYLFKEMEKEVKSFGKECKSHRHVGEKD